MTVDKKTDPYEFLKTRVQKTQDSSPVIDELRRENAELKKLLKESFESFPTKRMADRIYSIDGIERPEPEPIPMKPGEETSF